MRLLPCLRLLLSAHLALAAVAAHADQWTAPTGEELSMTSQPQVPGAAAVYLFREQTTEDSLHMYSVYERVKVLTEGGKKYGDVELSYAAGGGAGFSVSDVAGRTIHPDGTIIPFTGKPYEKLIEKGRGYKYVAKVFSMPDVQVGSIVEYRYKLRWDDMYYVPPSWFIQSELFTRKSHYLWKPTTRDLISSDERGQITNAIAWTPILPEGYKVKPAPLPGSDGRLFELSLQDIKPAPQEEYMPPIGSFSYRVLFYYSAYRTSDEYWQGEGKFWAKKRDKFIGPFGGVNAAVQQMTSAGDTSEQKLRKIYAAVQELENTDFTRNRSGAEDKVAGFGDVRSTDDIWKRKRGTGDQLTELFVAMARAAGMKSYLVYVSDRNRRIFYAGYLSMNQLDDYIAIVNIDGKEHLFDPGSRYCAFDHLMWKHSLTGGIRQADGGMAITSTPRENYTGARVQRVADLVLDEHGVAKGTVKMTYTGDPALTWRQESLTGDKESLEHDLQSSMEELLPRGMEVKVANIEKLKDYEQPLTVTFDVEGAIGSPTGKRLLLPGDLFEANAKATFPHEKRDLGVYFHYSHMVQDAVRIKFPKEFTLESVPVNSAVHFEKFAAYSISSQAAADNVVVKKNYTLGEIFYMPNEYPKLREFYNDMESKDQQNVVLSFHSAAQQNAASN